MWKQKNINLCRIGCPNLHTITTIGLTISTRGRRPIRQFTLKVALDNSYFKVVNFQFENDLGGSQPFLGLTDCRSVKNIFIFHFCLQEPSTRKQATGSWLEMKSSMRCKGSATPQPRLDYPGHKSTYAPYVYHAPSSIQSHRSTQHLKFTQVQVFLWQSDCWCILRQCQYCWGHSFLDWWCSSSTSHLHLSWVHVEPTPRILRNHIVTVVLLVDSLVHWGLAFQGCESSTLTEESNACH